MQYVDELMGLETNFDIIHRVIRLGDTDACMYLIDGFCKDELMQKILQYLMDLKAEDFPKDAHEMSKIAIPYVEVDLDDTWEKILGALLSGVFVLLLDGYEKAVLIDARTYPTRGVEEPDKDKVLRGSKDGFVETVVFNTALIPAGSVVRIFIWKCLMPGRIPEQISYCVIWRAVWIRNFLRRSGNGSVPFRWMLWP